jgi:hypothetical protein
MFNLEPDFQQGPNVNKASRAHVPVLQFRVSSFPMKLGVPIMLLECPCEIQHYSSQLLPAFARIRSGTSNEPLQ